MNSKANDLIKQMLAERSGTQPEDWYLTFKARFGMEIVFKQLAMSYAGKRVLTQLFTCATAVNPILVSGLKPVYAEVGMQSLSIDPAGLVVPSDTCAVVIQNTFGIIDNHSARQLAA